MDTTSHDIALASLAASLAPLKKVPPLPWPDLPDWDWEGTSTPEVQEIIGYAGGLALGKSRLQPPDSPTESLPLSSLLSSLFAPKPAATPYYPAEPLSPDALFPRSSPGEMETSHLVEGFFRDLHAGFDTDALDTPWMEKFDRLYMHYFSLIPSPEAGEDGRDIPLYDFARTRAALAVALWSHRQITNDQGTPPFLLVNGDFYGIQKFIFTGFGESRKLRSKILRGRSFYVALISDLAARLLLDALDLPPTSLLMNAAGKFTLLAPNIPESEARIQAVEDQINQWLITIGFGETLLGLSHIQAQTQDIETQGLAGLMDTQDRAARERQYAHIDLRATEDFHPTYLDDFRTDFSPPACTTCGKRPARTAPEKMPGIQADHPLCHICRDQIFLGKHLVKTEAGETQFPDNRLFAPIFQNGPETHGFDLRFQGGWIRIFRQGRERSSWPLFPTPGVPWADRPCGGHVPCWPNRTDPELDKRLSRLSPERQAELENEKLPGQVMTFNLLSALALNPEKGPVGTRALGTLKADVDNLGLIFSAGLGEKANLSRTLALSRQVNAFFTHVLPHLLTRDFPHIYTLFAGGDDLFLLGPWNQITALAPALRQAFTDYVGANPELTLSAGVTLFRQNMAMDDLAHGAEAALDAAKAPTGKSTAGLPMKSRLSIFGRVIRWDQLSPLEAIEKQLAEWIRQEVLNMALLHRLNHLIPLAEAEARLKSQGGGIPMEHMECTKWKYQLAYSLDRNITTQNPKVKTKIQTCLPQWLETHRGDLIIPLWKLMYTLRQK